MKVLLIIPAYNEGEGIVSLIAKIKQARSDIDYVVINDGSKDNTDELLKAHNINHVTLVKNLGIGGAVQTGYRYAKDNEYDIAIQFDGDGQHDINSVQTLIDAIVSKEGDLVIGSRFVSDSSSEFQSSFMRRVGITILSTLIKITTGKRILDVTSGNRACNPTSSNILLMSIQRNIQSQKVLFMSSNVAIRSRKLALQCLSVSLVSHQYAH